MSKKLGPMYTSALPISTNVQNINKPTFLSLPKICKSRVIGLINMTLDKYDCNDACMESTGKHQIPFLIFWRRITVGLLFLIQNIPSLKKATRQIVKTPSEFVIYICVE